MSLYKINKARINKVLRYVDRVGTNKDPASIHAGITDFCFNKCHMCGHWKRPDKKYIPLTPWIEFLSSHKGIESVAYAGGDMMTYPKINELMKFHIENDISFGFITTGFIPKYVDLNLLSNARWFRASLDSVDPDTYQKIRGGIDVSDVIESIKIAKAAGVNVELNISVSELSLPSLDELLIFSIQNELDMDMHPLYGETFDGLGLDQIKIASYIERHKKFGVSITPYQNTGQSFCHCHSIYYQLFIDSKGDIYPCCISAGDTKNKSLLKQPLGNITNWNQFLKQREKFHSKTQSELPKFCHSCIDRFGAINKIVDDKDNKNLHSFF